MTVKNVLDFMADIRGLKGKEKQERVDEIINRINLETVRDQTIDTLSKGFKRRVGVAQALMHDPEVLIMDEPTDGLDPNQKNEVRMVINEMAEHKDIIISTHIMEEVDAICTREIIIASGQLLFDGTPEELLARSDSGRMDDVFRDITTDFYAEKGEVAKS